MGKRGWRNWSIWHDAQVFHAVADILVMNGPAHMVFGASMTLLVAPPVHEYVYHSTLTSSMLVAVAVISVGATLIADLDTIKSRASSALGPVTRTLSKGVSLVSGGHRYGTHSILAVALVWLATWRMLGAWGGSLMFMMAVTTFLVSFAVRELVGDRLPSIFVFFAAIAIAFACLSVSATYEWMQTGIVVGYAMHLVADSLTTEGVRLLWPLSSRTFGLKAFTSDSFAALVVTQAAGAFMILLLTAQLVLPSFAANHPDLMSQSHLLQQLAAWAPTKP